LTLINVASVSNQTIHPYAGLSLYDIGEELSDNHSEFLANGFE